MQTLRRLTIVLIFLFLLTVFADGTSAEARRSTRRNTGQKSTLTRRLAEISRSKSFLLVKVRDAKKREKAAAVRLNESEHRLRANRFALKDVRSQLYTTTRKLNQTRSELDIIKARLKKRNDLLAKRLLANYRTGRTGYVSVLLGAEDFTDLLNRGYVVQQVVESDVDLIEEYKKDKKAVEEHEAVLEEQKRKRQSLEREQSRLTAVAQAETAQRAGILKEVSAERAAYEQKLAQLDRDSDAIAAMIRRLEATPAGKKRLAQVWKGKFMRPVGGPITSNYGMRFHPIIRRTKLHTGVDFGSPSGTPIHAAGGGEVVLASTLAGYGKTVVIDHGGGVQTLYAHQSRIAVRVGSVVKKGQTIGYVGSTGFSTGPHLHFEVRKHGVPVNPL